MQTYLCAGCGYRTTDLSECHDPSATGINHHRCPQCGEQKFHFQAPRELEVEARANGWQFIGSVSGHKWACAACRTAHNKPFVDFAALPVPAGWTDETNQHCGHRGNGIAVMVQGRRYGALVASQRLDATEVYRGAVIDGERKFVWDAAGDDYSALVAQADAEVTRLETEYETEIHALIADLHEVQQANNYKPGWVWFRIKDKYGAAIANEFLPKA